MAQLVKARPPSLTAWTQCGRKNPDPLSLSSTLHLHTTAGTTPIHGPHTHQQTSKCEEIPDRDAKILLKSGMCVCVWVGVRKSTGALGSWGLPEAGIAGDCELPEVGTGN